VDQGLHHLQGKAELVKPADLLAILQGIYGEKSALYRRHEAGARQVSGYAFNNTYQYILARETSHLSWLRDGIVGVGGTPVESADVLPVPAVGKREVADQPIAEDDARLLAGFLNRWLPRVEQVDHARHRKMLDLLLGEVAEHQRFFEQAARGQDELLGRRLQGAGTGGGVLAARWVE
jgi:hypothetical protein